jgi:hypothetical protein
MSGELIQVDLGAGFLATALGHLVEAAKSHRAAAHAEHRAIGCLVPRSREYRNCYAIMYVNYLP